MPKNRKDSTQQDEPPQRDPGEQSPGAKAFDEVNRPGARVGGGKARYVYGDGFDEIERPGARCRRAQKNIDPVTQSSIRQAQKYLDYLNQPGIQEAMKAREYLDKCQLYSREERRQIEHLRDLLSMSDHYSEVFKAAEVFDAKRSTIAGVLDNHWLAETQRHWSEKHGMMSAWRETQERWRVMQGAFFYLGSIRDRLDAVRRIAQFEDEGVVMGAMVHAENTLHTLAQDTDQELADSENDDDTSCRLAHAIVRNFPQGKITELGTDLLQKAGVAEQDIDRAGAILRELVATAISALEHRLTIHPNGANADWGVRWGSLLAGELERVGASNEANQLRNKIETNEDKARTLWLVDAGVIPPAIMILAERLWEHRGQEQLQREKTIPPALTGMVHRDIGFLITPSKYELVEGKRGQMVLPMGNGTPVRIAGKFGLVPNPVYDAALVKKCLDTNKLGSLTAQKALVHIIHTVYPRVMRNMPDARVLHWDDGIAGFARGIGIKNSGKAEAELRAIIETLNVTELQLPNGTWARLIDRTYSNRRSQSTLDITVLPALLPYFGETIKDGMSVHDVTLGDLTALVPVLPIPPMYGGQNKSYPAQSRLQFLTMRFMRDRVMVMVVERFAGVPITDADWRGLADEAELPTVMLPNVLEHWQQDHKDGPAVLERFPDGTWLPGPSHEDARNMLLKAGLGKRTAQRNGIKAKRAKARKAGRG